MRSCPPCAPSIGTRLGTIPPLPYQALMDGPGTGNPGTGNTDACAPGYACADTFLRERAFTLAATPTCGQSAMSAQRSHCGLRAKHTRRPCSMRRIENGVQSDGGNIF